MKQQEIVMHTPVFFAALFDKYLLLLLIYGCFAYMYVYVCHKHVLYPWKPEEATRSPGTGTTGGCKLKGECWAPNPGLWKSSQFCKTAEPFLKFDQCSLLSPTIAILTRNRRLFFKLHITSIFRNMCPCGWVHISHVL